MWTLNSLSLSLFILEGEKGFLGSILFCTACIYNLLGVINQNTDALLQDFKWKLFYKEGWVNLKLKACEPMLTHTKITQTKGFQTSTATTLPNRTVITQFKRRSYSCNTVTIRIQDVWIPEIFEYIPHNMGFSIQMVKNKMAAIAFENQIFFCLIFQHCLNTRSSMFMLFFT